MCLTPRITVGPNFVTLSHMHLVSAFFVVTRVSRNIFSRPNIQNGLLYLLASFIFVIHASHSIQAASFGYFHDFNVFTPYIRPANYSKRLVPVSFFHVRNQRVLFYIITKLQRFQFSQGFLTKVFKFT